MKAAAPGPTAAASLLAAGLLAATGAALAAASAHPWPLLVSLLIAPVLEETVFRAGLHDRLLDGGLAPWLANLMTAMAFCAAHLLLVGIHWQTALVWLPALLIGAAYNRWRRVRICIALHMAMNLTWLAATQGMA
ncbi:CPBP family glutamic-type intramembrane protease [Variovorax sp. J22R133]|uniref:JDVT-CTERM system glutamic-type intramembrane protease n=1 Tax=Variovorax brevis TaxID=3053503 RepID=UPI0025772BD7|nr:JDVT-CTERM system glutamic-type intramembrane protease [Variovorax sp. J22R133]MDM0110790.1 CPBP family glutamic-type intramembrane protease [Variovorax sp. J22R133]